MKKKLLVLIASITILGSITGCGDLLHGNGNVETGQTNYMLTRIENVPDGWETSKYMCFYYDINTSIIYVGKNDMSINSSFVYELKSDEYRNYVYDGEDFIGVE